MLVYVSIGRSYCIVAVGAGNCLCATSSYLLPFLVLKLFFDNGIYCVFIVHCLQRRKCQKN